MPSRVLVTGGLGFIGSEFVRRAASRGATVVNVDLDTYAGDARRIAEATGVETVRMDVADPELRALVASARPDVVVHFAAETHVTRSETEGDAFFRSNVDGTRNVLEAAAAVEPRVVVHVSTDEVYGPCSGAPFKEEDKQPGEGAATSAYARSKAVADDVARSYMKRLPVVVVRPTNCFGTWQHPEKAIPRWIARALNGRRLPVWGDGGQVRDWMAVADACAAIELLIERDVAGEVYNVAPEGAQRSNLEMARAVARAAGRSEDDVYLTAYDRPQHDRRYAVDASALRLLGWRPQSDLDRALAETVAWYRAHRDWWEGFVAEAEALYQDAAERAT